MTLDTLITEYLDGLATVYYFRQCAVIIAVFIFGAILTDSFSGKGLSAPKRCVLAFPVGISAFTLTAYAMIVAGIPYNRISVSLAVILEIAVVITVKRKSFAASAFSQYVRHMAFALAAAVAAALLASSGLAPVSISNDTMYYFRRYPDAIVYYGGLRDQFDFFMTDTGLGVVSIDTLPALFGFGESFGIREFFHIGFTAFFGMTVYERGLRYLSRKGSVISAVLITSVLAVSTPFVILGHWALANMYFMELFFIAAYATIDNEQTGMINDALMIAALALFRIEGTLFVVWLAVCLALYTGRSKEIAKYVILPVSILFGCYCIRIYTCYNILDNQYTFLTPVKAVLLVGLIVVCGLYLLFIFPRLNSMFGMKMSVIYIAAMVLGNLLLFIRDRSLYIGNLKAFGSNLFRQSGWGMLPYLLIAMTLLLVAESAIYRYKNKESRPLGSSNSFNIVMVLGFILIVLAASYGRGDVLSEEVGDSGNRVLLQIVPLLAMTYGELFIRMYSLL